MSTPTSEKLDVVGLQDIAKILQVQKRTPTMWRHRGLLPPEDGYVSGNVPIWHRKKIMTWAAQSRRLPNQRAADERAREERKAA